MHKLLLIGLNFAVCSLNAMSPQDELFQAINKHDVQRVEKLVNSGNVDVNQPDKYGYTPVMVAQAYEDIATMKLLLSKGAQVDQSILDFAISNDIPEMFWLGVKYGLKPTKDMLYTAIKLRQSYAVSELIQAGVPVDHDDLALVKREYEKNKNEQSKNLKIIFEEELKAIGRNLIKALYLAKEPISQQGIVGLPAEVQAYIATFM